MLNLKYNGNHKWSAEDDEIMRKFYPTEGKNVVKRFSDGRTEAQCMDRAHRLGLKNIVRNPAWTEEEDDYLRAHYPKEGSQCFAALPNRTRKSCYTRVCNLKIEYCGKSSSIDWTPEEEKILCKEYPIVGCKCFSKFPQYSTSACYGKVHRMGLARTKQWEVR